MEQLVRKDEKRAHKYEYCIHSLLLNIHYNSYETESFVITFYIKAIKSHKKVFQEFALLGHQFRWWNPKSLGIGN